MPDRAAIQQEINGAWSAPVDLPGAEPKPDTPPLDEIQRLSGALKILFLGSERMHTINPNFTSEDYFIGSINAFIDIGAAKEALDAAVEVLVQEGADNAGN
jgi:hypothetical protein